MCRVLDKSNEPNSDGEAQPDSCVGFSKLLLYNT